MEYIISIYPKLFDVEYGARNHTGQLLYIVVRPDVTNTQKHIVEFAAFYQNVLPTSIPLGDMNFELGQQDTPVISIPFKGFLEMGPGVEAWAERVLREEIIRTAENEGSLPFLDSYGSDPSTTSILPLLGNVTTG